MPIVKKTKIVATLGPATSDKDTLAAMIEKGVNVFRINFSHADYKKIKYNISTIRELSDYYGISVGILADLQGPKLRVGIMEDNTEVASGDIIEFITGEPFVGNRYRTYMDYSQFPKDVKPREKVLLDDGKLIFEILESDLKSTVKAKVIQGGVLKSNKGVNLPNTGISLPSLTKKDIKDAEFAIGMKVDWIALSFVRHEQDIQDLRDLIRKTSDFDIPIVAKIEKPEAIDNIDSIVSCCNALMVARGDLGVEVPPQDVPLLQKKLVKKAKQASIPVIIATQMMETMIDSLMPTRAEVNDVANSIMDGADAVMLSGETSVGKYPVQVIEKMTSIIQSVEDSELNYADMTPPNQNIDRLVTNSICHHAATMTHQLKSSVISTLTNSGYSAYQISALRPKTHILVFTSNKRIINQLGLLWGVQAFFYDKFVSTDETIRDIKAFARKKGYLKTGDILISLVAMPVKEKVRVNTVCLEEICSDR